MSAVQVSWQNATNDLAASVTRLEEAVNQRSYALVQVRIADTETALKRATAAASDFARSGAVPPQTLQTQWVATLTKMETVLRSARQLQREAPAANGGDGMLDAGFQIPGTSVIVPWAALLAVGAVAAVAWYYSRKRR